MASPIKCAAWKIGEKVFQGHRHGDCFKAILAAEIRPPIKGTHGFLDTEGNFLTRSEAYVRAVECGQIKDDRKEGEKPCLISEMLY